MYDLLPQQAEQYDALWQNFAKAASDAGYGRIETPLVEETGVFSRGVGSDTDIVAKEMYNFDDRGGTGLSLRPEATAGIVRSYLEQGMGSWPQPVRLYYGGAMFRYDRPQAGRQRQFSQFGIEVIGDASPSLDAQAIILATRFFKRARLSGVSLQINSIGCSVCRPKYHKALVEYLEQHSKQLADDDRARLKTNPLRVLDSKEERTQVVIADAPQMLNYLCEACQTHFAGVLEYLDDQEIAYDLNPHLVRGLDYYTRTVFEFYGQREGAQASLGGGGRYDGLVELLGGQPTPAVGFALGVERILLELEEQGISLVPERTKGVYVASLGEPARLLAFGLIEKLLDGDVPAVGAVEKDGIGAQLGRADKLGLPYAVIIGQREVIEKTVLLRDMASGAQETLQVDQVVAELRRRFDI
jgi:histidyl-tRNA synthetase